MRGTESAIVQIESPAEGELTERRVLDRCPFRLLSGEHPMMKLQCWRTEHGQGSRRFPHILPLFY